MSYFPKINTTIKDEYGFEAENTPMNQIKVAQSTRLVGATFVGSSLDSNFWTSAVQGSGNVSQTNSQIILSTNNLSISGGASITSVRSARYIGSASNYFRGVIRLPTINDANNIRYWGACNLTDGAFFQLSAGTLQTVTRKSGVDNIINQQNWNGSSFTLTSSAITYEIYLTNSKVYYSINDSLVNTFFAGSSTWTDNLTLPVMISNINSVLSNPAITIEVRTATINRLGNEETSPIYKNLTSGNTATVLKYSAGRLRKIVTNKKAGNNGIATVYDNIAASGNIIATMDVVNGNFGNTDFDLDFYTGLTVNQSGTSTGADLTVVYE